MSDQKIKQDLANGNSNIEMQNTYVNGGQADFDIRIQTDFSNGVSNKAFEDVDLGTKGDLKVKDVEGSSEEDGGFDIGMGPHISQEEKGGRPAWDNQVQFLLACIAYAVGLGNIWRFPYLAQTYGGGAFIIPYIIMLVFEGVPLFLLELAVGQRLRLGAIGAWSTFHPYLVGIGVGSMVVSFMVGLYYNTIIAWCFWYICNSFTDPLPYATCPLTDNNTAYVQECAEAGTTSYFWYRDTLNVSPTIDETGGLVWWVVVCLILAWTVIWVTMIKGIESSGKVMYVTATFPYLVLFIFLVRGLTLRGSSEGVSYLFTPDINVLSNPNVWLDAATQIFFSLGLGFGGVIAFASYNPKKQDCQRDAIIIALTNSFTSIFASIVIFAVLGYKATVQYETCLDGNIEILLNAYDLPEGNITYDNYDEEVIALNGSTNWENQAVYVESLNLSDKCDLQAILSEASQGTGLAFIVFTEAIINMPGSPVWSVLFFLMLLSLGLGSMFGTVEGVVTPLFDLGLKIPKPVLTGLVCLVSCVIGLMFCTRSGNYWLDIFNSYAGSIPLLVIAFFEITVVCWAYGIKNFDRDLEWMYGAPKTIPGWCLHYYFRACWLVISPVILLVVLGAYIYTTAASTLTYDGWNSDGTTTEGLEYPWFATMVIILLLILPIVWIPIIWVFRVIKQNFFSRENMEGILIEKKWKDSLSELCFCILYILY
ncbi:sodium-dependent neutral amino acid transporter B(0)AT3-like [Clavelina lepadiformis]|uniref:sodium-dependent neutral amino acid transporter B(0)AT3-like n=1 Tax=Clavelina lepadiformis TaxID=159417 RepID=UPI0040415FCA